MDLNFWLSLNFLHFKGPFNIMILRLKKMVESSPEGKKVLWEKENLLVTSNSSFSHSVIKRFVLQTLNPFPIKPWFLCVCNTSVLKTLQEKEKLLITSNFAFPTVFSNHLDNFLPFSSNLNSLSANSFKLE